MGKTFPIEKLYQRLKILVQRSTQFLYEYVREYLRERRKKGGRGGGEESKERESEREEREIISAFPRQAMLCLLSILQPIRKLWIFLVEGGKK